MNSDFQIKSIIIYQEHAHCPKYDFYHLVYKGLARFQRCIYFNIHIYHIYFDIHIYHSPNIIRYTTFWNTTGCFNQ